MWIATTIAFAGLGLFYVLFLKSDVWVASQGLIVRDEANGSLVRLGRFESQTDMKAAQETVLEMARNTQVLQRALLVVGRSPQWFGYVQDRQEPTPAEVEELARNGIEVRAPRGAELGTTEVIYLDVRDSSRDRAAKLNQAVCDELELQLKSVRQSRADGVIAELTTARDAARIALAEVTHQLQEVEAQAGADLSDLRGLTDSNTGGSTTRLELETIKSELRQVELQLHQLQLDLGLAKESFEDPDHLLLTPSRLVTNQPGLKKLREGLADAKIATSGLKGRFTEANAIVIVAMQTEESIREQLREELGLAIQTLVKDIEVTEQQRSKLQMQEQLLDNRLSSLAAVRAEYSNIVVAVRARNQELQDIERELGQVVASRNSASTSSLLTRVDQAIIGERPIGPGRSTIVLGATLGGLLFGLGIVFLLTPIDGYIRYGRRRSDVAKLGRRKTDPPLPVTTDASSPESIPDFNRQVSHDPVLHDAVLHDPVLHDALTQDAVTQDRLPQIAVQAAQTPWSRPEFKLPLVVQRTWAGVQRAMVHALRLGLQTVMTFTAWRTTRRWIRRWRARSRNRVQPTHEVLEKKLSEFSQAVESTPPESRHATPGVRKVAIAPNVNSQANVHTVILQALNPSGDAPLSSPPGSPTPG